VNKKTYIQNIGRCFSNTPEMSKTKNTIFLEVLQTLSRKQ